MTELKPMPVSSSLLEKDLRLYPIKMDIKATAGTLLIERISVHTTRKEVAALASPEILNPNVVVREDIYATNEPVMFKVVDIGKPLYTDLQALQDLKIGDIILLTNNYDVRQPTETANAAWYTVNGKDVGPGLLSCPQTSVAFIVKEVTINELYDESFKKQCLEKQNLLKIKSTPQKSGQSGLITGGVPLLMNPSTGKGLK